MIGPGFTFGKYEVGERLGKGGFGVVFRARDKALGRTIAIKFLRPEFLMRPAIAQRFLNEARAAAKIGHPGIVTVFECGTVDGTGTRSDGTAFIAMELLRGESLAESGRLPLATAIGIGRQLAAALAEAHAAGIVHRDLKPDNVFLLDDTNAIGGKRVKLLDFGIAKLAEPDAEEEGVHTHSQMVLGTPRYMAPEQARSSKYVDHRSDIYGLGCMLYELLCGHSPYSGDHADLIIKHQKAPIPHPIEKRPDVPPIVDDLIVRMMAKDPEDRPASMLEVEQTLTSQQPPLFPPVPPPPPPVDEAPTLVAPPIVTAERRRRYAPLAAVAGVALAGGAIAIAIGLSGSSSTPRATSVVSAEPDAAIAIDGAEVAAMDAEPDAARSADPNSAGVANAECLDLASRRRWAELADCADRFARFDQGAARAFRQQAVDEIRNEQTKIALDKAIATNRLRIAGSILAKLPQTSVYYSEADAAYSKHLAEAIAFFTSRAEADRTADRSCRKWAATMAEVASQLGPEIETRVRDTVPCSRSSSKTSPTVASKCDDVEALVKQGQDDMSQGLHGNALTRFDAAYACAPATSVANLAFLAACLSHNARVAKQYYPRISNQGLAQRCRETGTNFGK